MTITRSERRVILAYQANVRRVRKAVERHLRATWSSMEAHRERDVERMIARALPVVSGAQKQTAALTSQYLAAVASTVLGSPVRPQGASIGTDLRGVPSREVYRRPGETVWTALAAGKPYRAAVREGGARLLSLASTDLQLAKTHATRNALTRDTRTVGFQRVLTGDEHCALCVLASTQRYHKEDLLPIHPGCDCDVRPMYGDEDPGQVIDEDRLVRLHDEAEAFTDGQATRTGRGEVDFREVMVRDHGEYGPVLSWRHQDFTGPADI